MIRFRAVPTNVIMASQQLTTFQVKKKRGLALLQTLLMRLGSALFLVEKLVQAITQLIVSQFLPHSCDSVLNETRR